jgi:hypothetical protein
MLDNLVNWNTVLMIIVLVLAIHAGIKVINKIFSENKTKRKNSLF